jgi:hypothetical protein
MFPFISALSISRFTPVATRSESFTQSALTLSLIPFRYRLTFLGIDDLRLDDLPIPVLDDDDVFDIDEPAPETIVVTNVYNIHCVSQILRFLGDPSNLHITRCRLDRFPCWGTVFLKDIDIGEDLIGFLTLCLSEKLVIDGCPGFGDEVLTMMTLHMDRRIMLYCACARNVEDLSIRNCVDFSISTLKTLVETRRVPNDIFGIHQPSPIKVLRLSGYVPEVSSEDIEWFRGHVSEFSYDPTQ